MPDQPHWLITLAFRLGTEDGLGMFSKKAGGSDGRTAVWSTPEGIVNRVLVSMSWWPQSPKPLVVGFLCSLLISGCALSAPAHQLTLDGSSWTITALGGSDLVDGSKPTITFDTPATVNTGCRTALLGWDMDTDGASLVFDVVTLPSAPPCTADLRQQDDRLMSALGDIEAWSVDSPDEIVLNGRHNLRLERIRN
jgi:META domain